MNFATISGCRSGAEQPSKRGVHLKANKELRPEARKAPPQRDAGLVSEEEAEILAQLFQVLQGLAPPGRRAVLGHALSQKERLLFEAWAVAGRARCARRSGAVQASGSPPQVLCPPRGGRPGGSEPEGRESQGCERAERAERPVARPVTARAAAPFATGLAEVEAEAEAEVGSAAVRTGARADGTTLAAVRAPQAASAAVAVSRGGARARAARPSLQAGGVHRCTRRGRTRWATSVIVRSLCLQSRELSEQTSARAAHSQLLRARRLILARSAALAEEGVSDVQAFRTAVHEAVGGLEQDLGLGFHVQLSMRSWVRPPLHTPQSRSLEKTLDAWQRLAPFAAGACDGAARQQVTRKVPTPARMGKGLENPGRWGPGGRFGSCRR